MNAASVWGRFLFTLNMKKLILLFAAVIMFSSFTGEGWKTIVTQKNIAIKYKQAECYLDNSFKQRWFLLSFENTSASKIKVEWSLQLFDESKKCVTCDDAAGEYKYSLVLDPGQTKEGECSFSCAPELRIVSKLLDVSTSTSYPDFKITDVKVSVIQ